MAAGPKAKQTNPAKKRSWDYERTVKYLNDEKHTRLRENIGLIVIGVLLLIAIIVHFS